MDSQINKEHWDSLKEQYSDVWESRAKQVLSEKELGVVQVVLERYNREWLPALLDMRKKVDRGETLDDRELSLLSKAIEEARGGATFAKSHPEFKSLIERDSIL